MSGRWAEITSARQTRNRSRGRAKLPRLRLGLRADEAIQHRHVGHARDVDGLRTRNGPVQPEKVAGIAEDSLDAFGVVCERIARVGPVSPGVLEAAAVRVDQPAEEKRGPAGHVLALPVGQCDLAGLLRAWAVLREQAGPGLRVGIQFVPRAVSDLPNAIVWHHCTDRPLALLRDAGIAGVEGDPQLEHAAPMR